jgi:hypothetical protein
MYLDGEREKGFGAALYHCGRRPGKQHEDSIRRKAPHAGNSLGEITIEPFASLLGRGGRHDRGEKSATRDVNADRPRLVPVDEAADIGACADQKNTLRRDQPGGAGHGADAHDRVARDDQGSERRDVEENYPAARVFDADPRQEGEHKQANQRDVPQLNGAAAVKFEGKEVRQAVFAAEQV